MDQTNRQIDLGTLTLYDSNAVQIGKNDEETLQNITDAMVENAIEAKKNQVSLLQSLPEEQQIHDFTKTKLYLNLPEGGIQFPRSFKLPQEKSMTKWERFAKQKNIKKRKKTGMKYDQDLKMQVARWGKKSKKNIIQPAIMQQKQFNRNPFSDSKKSRKLTREKQNLKEIKNIQRKRNFQPKKK